MIRLKIKGLEFFLQILVFHLWELTGSNRRPSRLLVGMLWIDKFFNHSTALPIFYFSFSAICFYFSMKPFNVDNFPITNSPCKTFMIGIMSPSGRIGKSCTTQSKELVLYSWIGKKVESHEGTPLLNYGMRGDLTRTLRHNLQWWVKTLNVPPCRLHLYRMLMLLSFRSNKSTSIMIVKGINDYSASQMQLL